MCKTNAFLIQEKLKETEYVTLPWIQKEYGLDYTCAKYFLEHLIKRKWVNAVPDGIHYYVINDNLRLRKLERDETDGIVEDITYDCVALLKSGQDDSGGVNSFDKTSLDKCDADGAEEAIKILNKHKLVYECSGIYFVSVSRKTVEVLSEVVRHKRYSNLRKRIAEKNESDNSLKKLFDALFD